jgi:autophagy-related protein 9
MAGVAHLLFMPFLLFFMTLHFLLVNMYVWKSSKEYMGPREWSSVAKWTFREFNELPHVFERRLGPSYMAADDYLSLFTQSPIVSYLGRALLFLSGSLVAVLISFAALNDAILLHVKISQWNLLWYVGMLGVAFSVGKGMLPDEKIHPSYTYNLHAEMETALTRAASHTHHFPDFWKKRSWKEETHSAFSAMFQNKSKLFVMEIVATLMAPFVLCVTLPRAAVSICAFVHNTKIELPGLGDVCGYACFDFTAFDDENWEGRQMDHHNHNKAQQQGGEYDCIIRHERPKTRQGKMEKSFFSFKVCTVGRVVDHEMR